MRPLLLALFCASSLLTLSHLPGCAGSSTGAPGALQDLSGDSHATRTDVTGETSPVESWTKDLPGPPDGGLELPQTPDDIPSGPTDTLAELTDAPHSDSFDSTAHEDLTDDPEALLDGAALLDGDSEDVPLSPPPLFDHEMIQDPATASCTFSDHHTTLKDGVVMEVWHVTYYSWQVVDGVLEPILIQGYAARPTLTDTPIPGIVKAHGLGGFAEESHATGTAALLGMFVLAYTGPGGGTDPANTSEGLPASFDNGYRMFDVLTDLRGTWFWGHAMAAMRGVTCLANHPDVDPARLGVTGFSAGGVISNLVGGVDPRIKAAVPLSGVLAWGVATESPDAWQHDLLSEAGLSIESPEWLKLLELVDPAAIYTDNSAPTMIANGSSDEFFPLTAHMATYKQISTPRRMSLAGNFDHGCFLLTGGESPDTIEARADLRAKGAQLLWFHHYFGTDERFSYVPQTPTFSATPMGLATAVAANVDGGGSQLEVEEVKVWWSNDDAFLFGSVTLKEQGGGVYGDLALFPTQANTVLYVDVQYKTKEWLAPLRFSLSSEPQIPAGFVPHIRNVSSCL